MACEQLGRICYGVELEPKFVDVAVKRYIQFKDGQSDDELAREVIHGDWGNGEERKKRLTAAGHDYSAVQKRVNEILK